MRRFCLPVRERKLRSIDIYIDCWTAKSSKERFFEICASLGKIGCFENNSNHACSFSYSELRLFIARVGMIGAGPAGLSRPLGVSTLEFDCEKPYLQPTKP